MSGILLKLGEIVSQKQTLLGPAMTRFAFCYVYADACNYKVYGSVPLLPVVECIQSAEQAISAACEAGEFFIPEQVGLKPLQPCISDGYVDPTVDDHIWHRFIGIIKVDLNDGSSPTLSLSDIVSRFSEVREWDLSKSLVGKAQLGVYGQGHTVIEERWPTANGWNTLDGSRGRSNFS